MDQSEAGLQDERKKRRFLTRRALVVVFGLVLLLLVFAVPTFRSVPIRFEWSLSKGFLTISTESSPLGPLYSRLIASEAGSHIASELKNAGWKTAKGRLSVRVFLLLFVVGVDHNNAWNVEIIDPEVTPLMHAVENGESAVVQRLIADGADVNAQDQRGWTALTHASLSGRTPQVRELLAAGADPNLSDRDGGTPFLWAAWNCRLDAAIALIDAGANVKAKDKYGNGAMSSTRCPDLVRQLLNKAEGSNAAPYSHGAQSGSPAASTGAVDSMKLLETVHSSRGWC
jgi:hypothetical protein